MAITTAFPSTGSDAGDLLILSPTRGAAEPPVNPPVTRLRHDSDHETGPVEPPCDRRQTATGRPSSGKAQRSFCAGIRERCRATAAASRSSTFTDAGQSMHPSVMLWP